MDLTVDDSYGEAWDFNQRNKRERVQEIVRTNDALLMMGSTLGAALSSLEGVEFGRRTPKQKEKVEQFSRNTHTQSFAWGCTGGKWDGMYFVHEMRGGASSWENWRVQELLEEEGVCRVDQMNANG